MVISELETEKKSKVEDFVGALLNKSVEAYLMALEIINKPTISYRTEGFCFYISNAWELLLKAFIVEQKQSVESIVIEPAKNNRSLSLGDCINRVFSSSENATRNNLLRIVAIRDTATHLILPGLDYDLAPLFQKNVADYYDFITKKLNYKRIPEMKPFISLNYASPVLEDSGLKLFPNASEIINNLSTLDESVKMKYTLVITKHGHADFTTSITNDSDIDAKIIVKPTNSEKTHPYTTKEVINRITASIKLNGLDASFFTSSSFQKACKILQLKENGKYCYHHHHKSYNYFTYSEDIIGLIVEKFSDDNFRNEIIAKGCKKKRVAPSERNSQSYQHVLS